MTSVYLIGEVGVWNRKCFRIAETGAWKKRCFKIGVATNIQDRLSSLQSGNCRPLVCFESVACETRDLAIATEQECHRRLQSHHIMGEWFAVTLVRARAALQAAHRYVTEVDPQIRWAREIHQIGHPLVTGNGSAP
jgi:hypothetical protein